MKLRWSSLALREAEETIEYYERRQPGLGDEFVIELEESLKKVSSQPQRFAFVETLSPEIGYRRLRMARFPYLIVFRERSAQIEIVAVAHAGRDPNYWLGRDTTR